MGTYRPHERFAFLNQTAREKIDEAKSILFSAWINKKEAGHPKDRIDRLIDEAVDCYMEMEKIAYDSSNARIYNYLNALHGLEKMIGPALGERRQTR